MQLHWSLVLGIALTVVGGALSDGGSGIFSRFEYKHSFKGPHLVDRKNRVPFWDSFGNSLPSSDQVRLTPSIRSMKGSLWNTIAYESDNWEVETFLRVSGRGTVGGDGMAIWFRDQVAEEGPVFGSSDKWNGMGIILDSFDNDGGMDNPMISLVVNDGTKEYDHNNDGRSNFIGQCRRDFRNRPHPIRLRITYWNRELKVEYDHGSSPDAAYELCLVSRDVHLPRKGHFGLSAATGGLADDHDALKFLTTSLSATSFAPAEAPSMKPEEANKAQEMYDQYSQDLQQKKDEYAKEHPELKQHEPDMDEMYESPFDRSVNQILAGVQEIRETVKNLHTVISSGAVQPRQGSEGGSQRPPVDGGSAEAMISAALGRMSQEVQQVMRRNQEETNGILRTHGDMLRRGAAQPGAVDGGMRAAPAVDTSHISNELSALRREVRDQQAILQRLASQLGQEAKQSGGESGSSSSSSDATCLSYSTVLIVVLVEALVAVIIFWQQKKKAAAAEKKFF